MRDEELTAAIREVRDRVRARYPEGSLGLNGVTAPDLMSLLRARDAAEGKVASIGSVNPRPPGLKNSVVQWVKRMIARSLDWHVREQVEFNQAAMRCVHATIEALVDSNRALQAVASHYQVLRKEMADRERQLREEIDILYREAQELKDVRTHWSEWRTGFEERRATSEIHMLRTISELQSAFQHRLTLADQNFRESIRAQHTEFTSAVDRNTLDVQKRLGEDLELIRRQYEKLIHGELKVIRQKVSAGTAPAAITNPAPPSTKINVDWLRFAENFRGPEEQIRERQKMYAARFHDSTPILDIGCGRGEFLEIARDAGLEASGIDQSEECVALCRSKGLTAERADLFEFLGGLADNSLGGVYCSQVIEHLDPARLPDLVQLAAAKLRRGGLAAFETPNPECLAIFCTHFYLDPTHTRPVPPALLGFYMEEAGFGRLEVERLAPAIESLPALAELPESLRTALFGGLDYAMFGRKL